jgi:hypothetical protein
MLNHFIWLLWIETTVANPTSRNRIDAYPSPSEAKRSAWEDDVITWEEKKQWLTNELAGVEELKHAWSAKRWVTSVALTMRSPSRLQSNNMQNCYLCRISICKIWDGGAVKHLGCLFAVIRQVDRTCRVPRCLHSKIQRGWVALSILCFVSKKMQKSLPVDKLIETYIEHVLRVEKWC